MALAALAVFQNAVLTEAATAGLARQVAAFLLKGTPRVPRALDGSPSSSGDNAAVALGATPSKASTDRLDHGKCRLRRHLSVASESE